jgi:HAD superfamily hydrolase (TIGR01509 family)
MLLIFDCDGVLVDSELLSCRVDADILTGFGFPFTAEEVLRRFVGVSLKDMVAQIEAEHGRALPEDIGDRITCSILERFRTELQPIPGVREAILALPCRRCVASSSTPDRIAVSLAATGLADLFDHVFSSVEVERGKPAPDLYLHAAVRMETPPRDCIVIEDSVFGVRGARAAGMRTVGFAGGAHCGPGHQDRLLDAGAGLAIRCMQELPRAIDTIVSGVTSVGAR